MNPMTAQQEGGPLQAGGPNFDRYAARERAIQGQRQVEDDEVAATDDDVHQAEDAGK